MGTKIGPDQKVEVWGWGKTRQQLQRTLAVQRDRELSTSLLGWRELAMGRPQERKEQGAASRKSDLLAAYAQDPSPEAIVRHLRAVAQAQVAQVPQAGQRSQGRVRERRAAPEVQILHRRQPPFHTSGGVSSSPTCFPVAVSCTV